ncbi:D-hexose-6-phosphate mutarotase [Luteococcus sp. Sow4_B9]|uniref:D-hexose-6-phosphate mutarotase n=1 Tax=Luteococcus sp. Sow4_B9 TaxID=3438792 RepID=UPI003F9BAD65
MSTQTSTDLPQGITAETVNGLPALRVETELGRGLVFLHGAHVAEWQPAGKEPVLWMSGASEYAPDKPLRGGVPICFPWFGPGREGDRTPAHGFARLSDWTLVEARVQDGAATLALELTAGQVADLGGFPDDFTARLTVTLAQTLTLDLTVTAGEQPLDFEEALHTYFDIADVHQTVVRGLDGARFLDKVAGGDEIQQGEVNFTMETDRVYFSEETTQIVDGGRNRTIVVDKSNSSNTVVWNPWVDKSSRMADFGDDEWTGMCCVESANVLANAVSLTPGGQHTMSVTISAE